MARSLIDFGDARASNAFYELGALQMGMFDADRGQLAAFLDGSCRVTVRALTSSAQALRRHSQPHTMAS